MEKLNEIGGKLNTDVSSLKHKKSGFITKPVYFLIRFLIYELSLFLGLTSAYVEDKATYPISTLSLTSLFLILPIHAGNGILTIPGEKKFGLSKNIRIVTFLLNLLVSLYAVSLILGTVPPPETGVSYGVFDKSSLFYRGDRKKKV